MGPRYLVRAAGLEIHPMDRADRRGYLKDSGGIGLCNITKCCTEVCPEHIKITDNAIIPLKERVADAYYDPIAWAWRKLRGRKPRLRWPGPSCRCCPSGAEGLNESLWPELEPAGVDAPPGFVIRTDGASRGNPGHASAGAVLIDLDRPDAFDPGAVPDASISDYLGIQTNNVAEYTAVVRALGLAARAGRARGARCCSTRSSSWSSSTAAGGSRTRSSSRSTRRRCGILPDLRPLDRRARPRARRTRSPTRCATRRSIAPWPAARRRSSSGRLEAAVVSSPASEAAGWPRVAPTRPGRG